MDEKKEMYYALVMGDKGRWSFPVEALPLSVKAVQDDGIVILPLESEFVRTDTMKLYSVQVQGTTKRWFLPSPLEPEIAQEMRDMGVSIDEVVDEKTDGMEYFWRESSDPLILRAETKFTQDPLLEKKLKEEMSK